MPRLAGREQDGPGQGIPSRGAPPPRAAVLDLLAVEGGAGRAQAGTCRLLYSTMMVLSGRSEIVDRHFCLPRRPSVGDQARRGRRPRGSASSDTARQAAARLAQYIHTHLVPALSTLPLPNTVAVAAVQQRAEARVSPPPVPSARCPRKQQGM